jgi:hypothetical protein
VREEKKFKGFPLFFAFKNFQTALMGDIKQWASRHRRHRLCYCRRHRCSQSIVEKKIQAKG